MSDLAIVWDRFTVHKPRAGGRDSPYLWVFGFRVDLAAIRSRRFVIRRDATHPNLGRDTFTTGESAVVPPALDVRFDGLSPVGGHTVAGVVVVAWEDAATTDEVVLKAYDDAAAEIDGLVERSVDNAADDVLHERGSTPPEGYDISGFEDAIDARVRRTIGDGWAVLQPIADRFVGSDHVVIDLTAPHRERLDLRFRRGAADYALEGSLTYAP